MYGKGIAHFYDFFEPDSRESAAECAFVKRIAQPAASLFEIGAGVGNTAFSLASAGFNVTALEPDPEMFAVLMSRLALRSDLQRNLSPIPRAAGYQLDRKFDICLCAHVLHLIAPSEQSALFSFAAEHLVDGGIFILAAPVNARARAERQRSLEGERTFGEMTFQHFSALAKTGDRAWRTTWEFVTKRAETVLDHVVQEFFWQTKSADEIRHDATATGLTIERLTSDVGGAPFIEGDSRAVVMVARK